MSGFEKVLCVILVSVVGVSSLPAEYCNEPFNRSDCGKPPQAVFAYYKPGSRCEIEYWRGCPTLNRFENEVSCSFFCIARIRFDSSENEIEDKSPCVGALNTDDCRKNPIGVYTYNKETGECESATWKGCKTKNKFSSHEECERVCEVEIRKWEKELDRLDKEDLVRADNVLDSLLRSSNTTSASKNQTIITEDDEPSSTDNTTSTENNEPSSTDAITAEKNNESSRIVANESSSTNADDEHDDDISVEVAH